MTAARGATGALTALAVAALSACGGSSGGAGSCASRFDSGEWKRAQLHGSHRRRLSLAREVIRCGYVKRGDGKARVALVLGRAKRDERQSRRAYRSHWLYYLGLTNDALGPGDDQFLHVSFREGRVTRLSISPP